jgi:hypothetical protein
VQLALAYPSRNATRGPPVDDDAGFLNEVADSNSPREVLKSSLKSELRVLVAKSKALGVNFSDKLESLLDFDALRFYKKNWTELPRLGALSCSLFSLQASSAESERGFSRAGISDTALNNRLSPETSEAATIVRSASFGGVKLAGIVEDLQTAAKEKAVDQRSLKMQRSARALQQPKLPRRRRTSVATAMTRFRTLLLPPPLLSSLRTTTSRATTLLLPLTVPTTMSLRTLPAMTMLTRTPKTCRRRTHWSWMSLAIQCGLLTTVV